MSCQTCLSPRIFVHKVQFIIRILWELIEIVLYLAYSLPHSLHSINNGGKGGSGGAIVGDYMFHERG